MLLGARGDVVAVTDHARHGRRQDTAHRRQRLEERIARAHEHPVRVEKERRLEARADLRQLRADIRRGHAAERLANQQVARLLIVALQAPIAPDRERSRGQHEECEQDERQARAVAPHPPELPHPEPPPERPIRDDEQQPEEREHAEVEQHDQRTARDERLVVAQLDFRVHAHNAATHRGQEPVPVQHATAPRPARRVRDVRPLIARARPKRIRRFGRRRRAKSDERAERIAREEPGARRDHHRCHGVIGMRHGEDQEMQPRIAERLAVDGLGLARRFMREEVDARWRARSERHPQVRDHVALRIPARELHRVIAIREIRRAVSQQQLHAARRRVRGVELRGKALQQRGGRRIWRGKPFNVARGEADARIDGLSPHERHGPARRDNRHRQHGAAGPPRQRKRSDRNDPERGIPRRESARGLHQRRREECRDRRDGGRDPEREAAARTECGLSRRRAGDQHGDGREEERQLPRDPHRGGDARRRELNSPREIAEQKRTYARDDHHGDDGLYAGPRADACTQRGQHAQQDDRAGHRKRRDAPGERPARPDEEVRGVEQLRHVRVPRQRNDPHRCQRDRQRGQPPADAVALAPRRGEEKKQRHGQREAASRTAALERAFHEQRLRRRDRADAKHRQPRRANLGESFAACRRARGIGVDEASHAIPAHERLVERVGQRVGRTLGVHEHLRPRAIVAAPGNRIEHEVKRRRRRRRHRAHRTRERVERCDQPARPCEGRAAPDNHDRARRRAAAQPVEVRIRGGGFRRGVESRDRKFLQRHGLRRQLGRNGRGSARGDRGARQRGKAREIGTEAVGQRRADEHRDNRDREGDPVPAPRRPGRQHQGRQDGNGEDRECRRCRNAQPDRASENRGGSGHRPPEPVARGHSEIIASVFGDRPSILCR